MKSFDFEYTFSLFHVFLQGLAHFDEILREADGIIISRGNLGIDLPPEKVVFKSERDINMMLVVNVIRLRGIFSSTNNRWALLVLYLPKNI